AAEILNVRLASRVANHGLSLCERGRHDRVLGGHHARLVEEDPPATETGCLHLVAAVELDLCAQLRKGVNVRIEPAPADHVAAWRRYRGTPDTREQRPGEQERGANPARELVVQRGGGVIGLVDATLVTARLFGSDIGA